MLGFFDTELGRVQISPTIIRRMVLNDVCKSDVFSFPGLKAGEELSRKITEKCIRVHFVEGDVEITLTLAVRYGARIIREARELQGAIAHRVQLQAGINVLNVSINLESVFEPRSEPELIEEPQVVASSIN